MEQYGGHEWQMAGGEIDLMAWETGFHNGPLCVRCGLFFCEHGFCAPEFTAGLDDPYGEVWGEHPCGGEWEGA